MKASTIAILAASTFGLSVATLRAEPPGTTTTTTTTVESTPGIWVTVPDEFEGDYYTYNNHYYHGGRYERGDFVWEGKHYDGRYFHDGKWIYGGKWEHHHRKEKDKH